MIGLHRGTVHLEPHDEEWHRLFENERERLLASIRDHSLPVQHIGSTSICGIAAKPILDIMIATKEFEPVLPFVADLEAVGYEFKGENGVPDRHFFGKGIPRTVHLNVVPFNGTFWLSHLAFRDHLRQNPEAAREYEQLKIRLAAEHPTDRESYTNGKEEFVRSIIALAMGS
jgi:GrpB-like predicted nucleotidyltransferase (UPF0157 family)